MKLRDYVKDRFGNGLIATVFLMISIVILFMFHTNWQVVLIISILLVIGYCLIALREWARRKRFYDRLRLHLEELDNKYLLAETIEEPDFYDGMILYTVLRETGKSMNDTIASLRKDMAEFREYIELWVHEIKLPVASLQLMSHNDGNARYTQQIGRIDDYIENVLYYARSDSAQKDYLIRKVSLKRLFTDVALRYREELQAQNITLNVRDLDVTVMTDRKWLFFILGQLMINSIKYTVPHRDAQILVYAEDLPDKTILHFRDNGMGISAGDLPRIFEKSFTGENGRVQSKSTGMGLYLVQKLCRKLGHAIEAESVKDEFTEIRISFGKISFTDS